ncbi:hypothetical protein [Tropicimonas sp.]|uniref:hypothetical protein n=1 Tax=Tropicimonas sp. TaxID=2067044 RepID=UPI003A84297A
MDRAQRFRIVAQPAIPLDRLVAGRSVGDVAELLPRIFNMCRTAQWLAARLALGIAPPAGVIDTLCDEIAREHALALAVRIPAAMGLPPGRDLRRTMAARHAVLLPQGDLPGDADGFRAFLRSRCGIAPLLRRIDRVFGPDTAVCTTLPTSHPGNMFGTGPVENSCAVRHASHPAMRLIETTRGRGPLWRIAGRVLDLVAAEERRLPLPCRIAPGYAVVPASRGSYGLRCEVEAGVVRRIERATPTGHMLAPGGIAEQAMATLPPGKRTLAEVALAILDPGMPVKIAPEKQHA